MHLDTSIIVELLRRPKKDAFVQRILGEIGDEILFASPIQFGELADAARASKTDVARVVQAASSLLELVPLDPQIALEGSALKAEARARPAGRTFSLIDGVVLATARSKEQKLFTMDEDFRGFADVVILERPNEMESPP